MSGLKPCPFCGEMPKVNNWEWMGITDKRCFCDNENCPVYLSKTIAIDDWNTRPLEDALRARIAELEADLKNARELIGMTPEPVLADGTIVYKLLAEAADKKIANLHKVITKQSLKIERQAERITMLEALYSGTKRSKKAATIKAKYKALKQAWNERVR